MLINILIKDLDISLLYIGVKYFNKQTLHKRFEKYYSKGINQAFNPTMAEITKAIFKNDNLLLMKNKISSYL
jgi:hypothetical protein